MLYYNCLLQTSKPLYNSEQLTDEQRNAEFFTTDRDILACCPKVLKSNHPDDNPCNLRDVLSALRRYLAPRSFRSFESFRLCLCDKT